MYKLVFTIDLTEFGSIKLFTQVSYIPQKLMWISLVKKCFTVILNSVFQYMSDNKDFSEHNGIVVTEKKSYVMMVLNEVVLLSNQNNNLILYGIFCLSCNSTNKVSYELNKKLCFSV